MRSPSPLILAALSLASAVHAFTYSVGVGKSEVTGNPGIGFDPSRIVIIGHEDEQNEVVFEFLEGIHRVVQVSPDQPCASSGGFDSGVQRVQAGVLQQQGPSATFNIDNNTGNYYFADIAEDNSPCYLGAVFCINSDETSATDACHAVIARAQALGTQYGVSTTPAAPGASSSTSASSSGSASSASTSSSSSTSSMSAPSSTASRTSSGTAAPAQETGGNGGNGAAAIQVGMGAVALVGAAVAVLA
ncbi:hypothetical protein Rhopal_004436-T1 [Rhodotorula paludigena]|uniref:Extracellular serine-rich protein n=1 Tax=Rhodotorula paludigena TaxID=86838 RepID=A0AAV5GFU3_9BASI|nr:hypothetical protein Rhopal_004436-T1 [Rhodotorula paludigena]